MSYRIIYHLQEAWAQTEDLFNRHHIYGGVYDVEHYFFKRPITGQEHASQEVEQRYNEFLERLSNAISNSVEINIALGEMGNNLMERREILGALKNARQLSNARISIVHGPNVDPKTLTIFSFANAGIVNMYQTDKYIAHHFILAKQKDTGKWFIADENPHSEGLWEKIGAEIKKVYRSIHRTWYVVDESKSYSEELLQEFQHRITVGHKTSVHPGCQHTYTNIMWRLIVNTLQNFKQRFFDQPRKVVNDRYKLTMSTNYHINLSTVSIFIKKLLVFSYFIVILSPQFFTRETPMSDAIEVHPLISSSSKNRIDLVNIGIFYSALSRVREIYLQPISEERRQQFLIDVTEDVTNVINRFSSENLIRSQLENELNHILALVEQSDDAAKGAVRYTEAQVRATHDLLVQLPPSNTVQAILDSYDEYKKSPISTHGLG